MGTKKVTHDGDLDDRRQEEVQGQEGQEEGRRRVLPSHPKRREEVRRSREVEAQGSPKQGGSDGRRLTPLDEAKRMLREVHSRTDRVIVALSGGKDSLVTLDLCVREFGANVSAFYMYLVKDMRCVETTVRWCEKHYGITVHRLPHWMLGLAYKNATYMPHRTGASEWRDMRLGDVEQLARKKSGAEWIAYGHRMADSIERVGMLKRISGFDEKGSRAYPLWAWNEAAVVAYLRAKKIPAPPKLTILKRSMTGVSFNIDMLLAIRDKFPDDYAKILEVFPLADAKIARHEMQKTSWKQKTYLDLWGTSLKDR